MQPRFFGNSRTTAYRRLLHLERGGRLGRHGQGIALQAKYFIDSFGQPQWRQLDASVSTALRKNAEEGVMQEYVIALPRNLTQAQQKTWNEHSTKWRAEASRLKYKTKLTFTRWGDSELRGLLAKPLFGGHLLFWFGYPDFDFARCLKITQIAVERLGDRYLPNLHTRTSAEGSLHAFLRTEHFRLQFVEEAKAQISARQNSIISSMETWPSDLKLALKSAEEGWGQVLKSFGDGFSLPPQLAKVADVVESMGGMMESCR